LKSFQCFISLVTTA